MYRNVFKRIIDFVGACCGFIVLFPIFFLVYIMLFFTNKKQPFYRQQRPGKNEKVFEIIKFKSMSDATDASGKLLPDAERLTRIGNFLRKSSLDEIPQLINVIKGDMSLVGPRPLRVRYLPFYTQEEKIRHTVKPGITGLAQVSGRNKLNWDQKLALDVAYVKKLNLWLDFVILLKTVKKIFHTADDEIVVDLEMDALDTYRINQKKSKINKNSLDTKNN
ncbi:sugar transferase [Flagellimonas nanhaiensis]|uniref:Sugar transferase n=1 Tax=Flagellimonas nanhaiensis TaxID=2292706 RepID=A0A371JKV3_9FLAO|nr:sugar transferase [Allomuricauda nanhaiensis]RDY57580.1 sugar transferase [Allomuricauda nanhaiensis]